jgi:RNA polymerase sigma-70 factor (ECF subfamily)
MAPDKIERPGDGRDPTHGLRILDEFIASLNGTDRAVFLLYLDDVSYREMSQITGFSEANLRVKISRLKKLFSERYIEE